MESERNHVLVIIPTYNRAQLLPDAIESVLSQDYPFVKVVVVDDGSTDHTREVCVPYTYRNPGRVLHIYKENGGCSSARNRGLDLMDSEIGYVCFLDSDDRLLPGKLRREVELLRNNPDADFVYSNYTLYDEETQCEEVRRVAAADRPKSFAIEHFLTNEAKSAAILYRAEVVRQRRFREDLRYNEDSEFLQRVAIECKSVYSPYPSCWVRSHTGSKSRNLIEIHQAVLRVSLDILESYPSFNCSFAALAERRIKRVQRVLFIELVLNKRWDEAQQYAQSSMERLILACRLGIYYRWRRRLQLALRRW